MRLPYNGNIQAAIKDFIRECGLEKVNPPNIYKNIEDNKLNMRDMNL